MAILWCDGQPHEKITELYHVLQDNHQEMIAWSDKDAPETFKTLFDFATKIVFTHFKEFPLLKEDVIDITEERIKVAQDRYDQILEDFIDNVFDVDSSLKRD